MPKNFTRDPGSCLSFEKRFSEGGESETFNSIVYLHEIISISIREVCIIKYNK